MRKVFLRIWQGGIVWKKKITFIIEINDTDETLCGSCFSKKPLFYGSGEPDYRCTLFAEKLNKNINQPCVLSFGELPLTERCSNCLLITRTKKKYMYET